MSALYVTPHFSWAEFDCHDGELVPIQLRPNVRRLCETVLEPLRARWNAPLIVVSGYRSHHYHEALRRAGGGGGEHSRHLTGEAADIRPIEMAAVPRLKAVVDTLVRDGALPALGGYGVYPGWVHLDVRQRVDGHLARWQGYGVGSEV